MKAPALTDLLDVAVDAAKVAEPPTTPEEANRLLTAVLRSGDELADLATRICPELKAVSGRCPRCGRVWLLRRALWTLRRQGKGHPEGGVGCLLALPLALLSAVRRSQATVRHGGLEGASPSPPRFRRYRGTGTTIQEGER